MNEWSESNSTSFTKSSLSGWGLWDQSFIGAPTAFVSLMLTWHFACAALFGCYLYDILSLQLNVIFFKVGDHVLFFISMVLYSHSTNIC